MWVDTCLTVPTLGLQTLPTFTNVFDYPDKLRPMLDEFAVRDQGLGISPDRTFGFQFQARDGFTYKLVVDNLVVEFEYRPIETRAPGRLPISTMPAFRKYTDLVDETVRQMGRILALISTPTNFPRVIRFGMVAKALLEKSKAPPGVLDLIHHNASFFPGELIKGEGTFLTTLGRGDGYQDRCHHSYAFDDIAKADDLTVTLDWQRVFSEPANLANSLERIREMKDSALAYFEKFGEGGLNSA